MKALHQKKTTKKTKKDCPIPFCFFCTMNEPDPLLRSSRISDCFKQMPLRDSQELVLALSGLWNIAMIQPNNTEFPSHGIFECMAKLIIRGLNDKEWLLRDQNIYIPYYAAHIIGSYSMNKPQFAEIAIKSGVLSPLMDLLRGKLSWVEQRVAVRALGHLASHETTFELIAANGAEVVELAMEIASTCIDKVYRQFFSLKERLKYQSNLITRGLGGMEFENRKAEEWASQSQCWSLYLLNCFVLRERYLNLICREKFLKGLCQMWGGVVNPEAPAGIGLLRTLCNTETGRRCIANLEEVLKSLSNVARSSDEWQFMAIECLLELLKDPETRYEVFEFIVFSLIDLVELGNGDKKRQTLGDRITRALLQDYHKIKYGNLKLQSERSERALEEVWELKVEKRKREKLMSEKEVRKTKLLVSILKQQGNHKFGEGEMEKAVKKYTEALDMCLPKMRKQRVVLHSNRAQCFLLQRNPEAAISDTTRALCLSMAGNPHSRSLWRRSQAYDMKGMAKESLKDCLLFVSCRIKSKHSKHEKIPYYAARMINKQMNATWIFASIKSRTWDGQEEDGRESMAGHGVGEFQTRKMKTKEDG